MKTVLVVDDLRAELELIKNYLTRGGYLVMAASSGQEALQKIEETVPDAIILDMVMPDMSGLELCRKLKNHPSAANVPIIACTTKNRDIDKKWAAKQGVEKYVVKPCTQDQLVSAVHSLIN